MDSTNIIIPFDFPFAILGKKKMNFLTVIFFLLSLLEHRHNPDPTNKLVYAVADGQYTYGPLSLYQYHNDEKYSKTYVHILNRFYHSLSLSLSYLEFEKRNYQNNYHAK
jgi:hypothetical protein